MEPTSDIMQSTYGAITTLSCLYKHLGFVEEQEVRVIAIPAHSTVRTVDTSTQKIRKIPKTFVRNGCPISYIDLFVSTPNLQSKILLPIKRVIFGPHHDKLLRKEAVELILGEIGIDAPVEASEIPFVGR